MNGVEHGRRVPYKVVVTQINSLSGEGTAKNRKKPCRESREPVESQECSPAFLSRLPDGVASAPSSAASARILRTLSAWPNHQSKWNVANHCLSHLLRKFSDGDTTVLHDQSPYLVNELVISACSGPT